MPSETRDRDGRSEQSPASAPHPARRRRARLLGGGAVLALLAALAIWTAGTLPGRGPARGSPAGDRRAARAASPAQDTLPPYERNAALHVPKPPVVRGLYLNAWAAGSPRKLEKLLRVADSTEINTFVIDVKEGGQVSYLSGIPLVRRAATDRPYIRDIRGVLARLKAHGVYPIARIVCFKDTSLARAKPEWAIRRKDGSLWRDDKGIAWVDAYNRNVWDYNIAIAREALDLGFGEVQWDYVRFPDVVPELRATQNFTDAGGRTRTEAIREFVQYSRQQLAPYRVPVTADVFGATVKADDDMGIGQKWERLVDVADVLLPMVYPSHFYPGDYDFRNPNAHPYQVVRFAMRDAFARSQVPHPAAIRPWLQDFDMGTPRYGVPEIRAQIQAVYDSGLKEWILWNPGSNYTVAALRRKGDADMGQSADKSLQQTKVLPTPRPDSGR